MSSFARGEICLFVSGSYLNFYNLEEPCKKNFKKSVKTFKKSSNILYKLFGENFLCRTIVGSGSGRIRTRITVKSGSGGVLGCESKPHMTLADTLFSVVQISL